MADLSNESIDYSKLINLDLLQLFGERTIVPINGTIATLTQAVGGLSNGVEKISDSIAPEETSPAQTAHAAGVKIMFAGTLYKTKTNIAVGDTLTPDTNIEAIKVTEITDGIILLIQSKFGDFVSVSDVTIDSVVYHTYWQVAPTGSNDVYGVAVHPTNGRLCRIRNNAGTLSMQYYDKDSNTTTGDGIKTKVAKTGTAQSSVENTIAANTTMDNAIGALLNNDKTLAEKLHFETKIGTLSAGSTSITLTFTEETIGANTLIDIYSDTYGVNPTAVATTSSTVTLTFDSQASAVKVGVTITN